MKCDIGVFFENLSGRLEFHLSFGAGIIFLILAHPVYKMCIIQEPDKLDL